MELHAGNVCGFLVSIPHTAFPLTRRFVIESVVIAAATTIGESVAPPSLFIEVPCRKEREEFHDL